MFVIPPNCVVPVTKALALPSVSGCCEHHLGTSAEADAAGLLSYSVYQRQYLLTFHTSMNWVDAQVWTWGEPWGDFSMKVDRAPRPVEGASGIAKIVCGAFHNLALTRPASSLS